MVNKRLVRAVIFDWGGVLMRTEDRRPRLAWDLRLGLPLGSVEAAVHGSTAWKQAQSGQITLEQYWSAVATQIALNESDLSQFRTDYYGGDHLDQSLIALIRDLKARHVRIGLLSNYTLDLLDLLSALGIGHLFDACVISAEISVMKPAGAAYLAVLSQLAVTPPETCYIDDAAENVTGAQALGIYAIQFSPGIDLRRAIDDWLAKA